VALDRPIPPEVLAWMDRIAALAGELDETLQAQDKQAHQPSPTPMDAYLPDGGQP
jgi:hypothetical protein